MARRHIPSTCKVCGPVISNPVYATGEAAAEESRVVAADEASTKMPKCPGHEQLTKDDQSAWCPVCVQQRCVAAYAECPS